MKNELKRLLEQTLTMDELLDKINQIDPLHEFKIWDYIINESEFLDLIKTQSLKQILKTISNINRQEPPNTPNTVSYTHLTLPTTPYV